MKSKQNKLQVGDLVMIKIGNCSVWDNDEKEVYGYIEKFKIGWSSKREYCKICYLDFHYRFSEKSWTATKTAKIYIENYKNIKLIKREK